MKIGTTRVNEQIGHATAVAVIRDDNLRRLSLNQTADLAGGGPLRLIGGATNEWQASWVASTHAKIYTGCWFLDHGYNLQTAEHFQKYIQRSLQLAKQQHESWQRTFGLSCPCLRLVLVQLEGKVEAVGTCKWCQSKNASNVAGIAKLCVAVGWDCSS